MKTHDANALRHLEGINAEYEGQIVPSFSRGHVHVVKNQDQAAELSALRNKLWFYRNMTCGGYRVGCL
jgi:hypothetical protein